MFCACRFIHLLLFFSSTPCPLFKQMDRAVGIGAGIELRPNTNGTAVGAVKRPRMIFLNIQNHIPGYGYGYEYEY